MSLGNVYMFNLTPETANVSVNNGGPQQIAGGGRPPYVPSSAIVQREQSPAPGTLGFGSNEIGVSSQGETWQATIVVPQGMRPQDLLLYLRNKIALLFDARGNLISQTAGY